MLVGVLSFGVLAGAAHASVPGWARTEGRTRLDVSGCAIEAASAIQSVTGKTPTKVQFDSYTWEIRSSTSNVGIFAYCTASPVFACPNRPAANLIVLTFSSQGSTDAAAKRDAVTTAFGDPRLIDCNV
jgi:hypothetical protein